MRKHGLEIIENPGPGKPWSCVQLSPTPRARCTCVCVLWMFIYTSKSSTWHTKACYEKIKTPLLTVWDHRVLSTFELFCLLLLLSFFYLLCLETFYHRFCFVSLLLIVVLCQSDNSEARLFVLPTLRGLSSNGRGFLPGKAIGRKCRFKIHFPAPMGGWSGERGGCRNSVPDQIICECVCVTVNCLLPSPGRWAFSEVFQSVF